MRLFKLAVSHLLTLGLGFVLGIYALPILIQPPTAPLEKVMEQAKSARYQAQFKRELTDSDSLHWGEGTLYLSDHSVEFAGELAPGPDYRLYLTPTYVETERDFLAIKEQSKQIARIDNFGHFSLSLEQTPDYGQYTAVIIWCETFGQFITAGRYRE